MPDQIYSIIHPNSSITPRWVLSSLYQDPLYNKGIAFDYGERDRLNIRGLLPPRTMSFKIQLQRVSSHDDDDRSHSPQSS